MNEKLDWNKFEHYFKNGWSDKLQPLFSTKEMWETYQYLKERGGKGANILPKSNQLYRAFEECSWDKLKVVVLGYDPYPQFINGLPVADGLAFSSSNVNKIPDSLAVLYDAWDRMYSGCEKWRDLQYLANQGVLLLNSALTVEVNAIGSHSDKCPKGRIWEFFIQYVLDIISTGKKNVVFILLGKEAHRFEPLIKGDHLVIREYHPSYYNRIEKPMPFTAFHNANMYLHEKHADSILWANIDLPF
jgi:uracil-DNA glycosylase